MAGAIFQAAATLLLAAGLAAYVALRPARSPLRLPLLGVLFSLTVWSAGVILRFTAGDPGGAFRGFVIGWLGIASLPGFWLLLAARYARVQALEERPLLALVPFVPAALAWAALATNPRHHLFLRAFDAVHVARGPLFYAWLLAAYPCVLGGIGLFVGAARRAHRRDARLRVLLATVAGALPTGVSLAYVFHVLRVPYDPTPTALGISVAMLIFGIFRLELLDSLPLARRDVIEHLRDGVVITDVDGMVIDANPAALRIFEAPLASLRGRPLRELLLALSVEPRAAEAAAAAVAGLPPDAALPAVDLSARADRRIEFAAKCLRGPSGTAVGAFAVLSDRTEQRRYERLLHQSQKLETVGSLAAGVAHEVNNPLAFVRANLTQLGRLAAAVTKPEPGGEGADPEDLEEMPQLVAECLDGIERIARTVDGLRRFSRVPSDELGPVDVGRAVHEAIRLAELHRNRGVTVEAWVDGNLPPVHGSAQRLTQVFLNLLINAKQALAGREDGRIGVRARGLGDAVEVTVSDNGPGVPEAIRDRIFDPFFTTKGPEEGTGLGLAIALDIVREHGGELELRPGPHGGSVFEVHLPASDDVLPAS
jgi:signal transduction histidine kinase